MFKKLLIAAILLCAALVFSACAGNGNGEETPQQERVQEDEQQEREEATPIEAEPTPTPTPEPVRYEDMYVPAYGSISLRVETMGSQQWDGVQIPIAQLGLEIGNAYEFTFDFFTPVTQDEVDISILLQTSGPLWRHIAPSPVFTPECDMEWHNLSGVLDLAGVASLPDNIQIVKNASGPNPSANTTFYIDNFTVRHDGEIIAFFNFEDDRIAPFADSGQALVMTAVADVAAERAPIPEWDMTLPSLANRWGEFFILGNIIEPHQLRDNPRGVIEMFLHHYTSVTAENAMKVDAVSGGGNQRTRPASLNLDGARAVVNFAEQNDMYMVGHTLVWHSQSAPWLYRDAASGEYLTRGEAKENMRWFIEQYAGYFGDRIDAWDVTNEVFTNSGGANRPADSPYGSPVYDIGTWQRALRNYVPWYHAFSNGADFDAGERGYDYIYYAFVFARRYAPNALLIYNDFNEENPHKRNAMANMTEQLNERWHADAVNNPAYGNPNHRDYGRLLIEVIGMQAHYNSGTDMNHIRLAIERFIETGARIHVTELDIHFRGRMHAPFTMTEQGAMQQAEMFAQLFQWYYEFSDYIDRVTLWGREDASSWRGDAGATHFDRFYRPKPAFWAIYDPWGWRGRI